MFSKLIDVHTHTQFVAFKDDFKEVIQRALDAGIWMVNVGTQKDTSLKAIKIANKYSEGVYATVGIHPIHTDKSFHDKQELGGDDEFTSRGEEFDYEYYKKLVQDKKVVAIGECGLDYYHNRGNQILNLKSQKLQKETFISQVELACEVKKPLMIHCREAYEDLIEILNTKYEILNTPPGVMHFFSGTKEDAKKLLDMGFYFSFGGVITFTRDYDEIVKMIPINRILSETDAPYVTPAPYRGKRNEPIYIIEVVKKLAEIKDVSFEETRERIFENARRVFGLK